MIRKGVISNVLTMPRPKNLRLSNSASPVPINSDRKTLEVTMTTVFHIAARMRGLNGAR